MADVDSKRGQMAIFVIIAIVVVGGILAYVLVKSNFGAISIPRELSPVFEYYDSCIKERAREALDVAGSQGGYVIPPNYIPGSEYAPSSNQLDFLGFPVPYWFYVSANGVLKEQVPTRQQIEKQVADFVRDNIGNCNFDSYYGQGFSIQFGSPSVSVSIADAKTTVDVSANVVVSKEDVSASKSSHKVELASNFGKLFKDAINIYEKQKNEAFLENYSVDVLRLYAPVDGVDTSCSSKIWKTNDVVNDLQSGLEANIAAIRFKGSEEGANKYFIINENIDENVNLIYSRNWPTKIEIYGDGVDQNLIVAEPVGSDAGVGLLGFCYIPYHFVYDLTYPVMFQIYKDNEIFQFPVIVIIDKNLPKEADISNLTNIEGDYDLCKYKDYDIQVGVYDVGLNKINANISYECLNQKCNLGQTTNGLFVGGVPGCVNGYVVANAAGYAEKKQLFSSNSETSTDIIMDREYDVKVGVDAKGKSFSGSVVISFENNDTGKTVSAMLPDVDSVKLSEGNYVIKAYLYGNASVNIPESTKTECKEVPKGGVLSLFGATEERCFDITLPGTKIDNALVGGGKTETYILPSDLEKGKVQISADTLPTPTSLEQLQYNFESFDNLNLDISFR